MDYEKFLSQFTDYKPITTFWMDYSIADQFGVEAVKDTFNRTFKHWKSNYKYLTELVMVLNHKIWQWYDQTKTNRALQPYVDLYQTLWEKADAYAMGNLKDEELSYFLRVTD